MFGLFGLISSFQLLGRVTDLHIYAPGKLKEILEFYEKNFSQEQRFRTIVHPLGYKGEKVIYSDNWLEVISFPLVHRIPACGYLFREIPQELNLKKEAVTEYKPGVEMIHRIRNGEDMELSDGTIIKNSELTYSPWLCRSYAYCSDTAFEPAIAETVKGTDLLYHEATFSDDDRELAGKTLHSTSKQAAMIAKLSGSKKLLLGHFSPRYQDLNVLRDEARTIFPDSVIVNDGDEFIVGRIRSNNESD